MQHRGINSETINRYRKKIKQCVRKFLLFSLFKVELDCYAEVNQRGLKVE